MVAVFISESEDTNSLEEVLEQIKSLNPGWQPRNFLVDFSMAEIAAIEKTMPSKFILLCNRFYFIRYKMYALCVVPVLPAISAERIQN